MAPTTYETTKALFLALAVEYLNGLDFHFKEQFDSGLDFRLGCIGNDAKCNLLVLFGYEGGLFGHDRRQDDLHQTIGSHPSISSS